MRVLPFVLAVTVGSLLFVTRDSAASAVRPAEPFNRAALSAALASVDEAELEADLAFVASDLLEGRDSPSSGLRICASFIENRMRRLRLAPGAREGFLDPFPYQLSRIDLEACSLRFEREGRALELDLGSDYYLDRTRQLFDQSTKGAVVVVGEGRAAEFEAVDLAGKWALCFQRSSATSRVSERAQAAGAVGVIYTPGPNYKSKPYADKYTRTLRALAKGTPRPPQADFPQLFLRAQVLEELLAWLELESDQLEAGADLGCEAVERRQLVDPLGVHWLENVCALWPGTDLAHEVIIISAHYDHVGTRGELIYNGADDNGSGTTGLMALAQALTEYGPMRRSVLLLWVAAEEKGLFGSAAWTERPWLPEGMYPICNVNIDMIGRNAPDDLCITPTKRLAQYNGLTKLFQENAALEGFKPLRSADAYWRRSDHKNFAENLGLPVAFLFADVHEDYHEATDTIEKIDFGKVRRSVRLVMRVLDGLQADQLDLVEGWKPDPEGFAAQVQQGSVREDLDRIAGAVVRYALDHDGRLPKTLGPLEGVPKSDPWGGEYTLQSDDGRSFRLLSLGADGVPGGGELNGDISWPPVTR